MFYNPAIELMPLPQLRQLQNERLQKLVHYVYTKVPFYRTALDKKGIKPKDIKGVGDLHKLPFTYKSDLRDNYPFGLFAVPETALRRIHCSSGTTGKPTVVGYTTNDLDIFAIVNARSLMAGGALPGMKLHNAYGYGLFTGGLGLHAGAEKLGMAVVPVSGGMTDRQLLLLQDFKPEVICCTPSYAQTLAEEVNNRRISLDSLNLKFAILGAEPWTETIRQDVEKGLKVNATNIYGLSEIMGPGISQEDYEEKGSGSYIWEDHFFPEVVDPQTGEPLPEGKNGVLIFTTLTKEAFPLLRYWTNDICSIYYDKSAKRTHIKMSAIKGRSDDMLVIRGVNFFHTQVEEVIQGIEHLEPHYQVVVSRPGTMDEVEIKVEVSPAYLKALGMDKIKNSLDPENENLKQLQGYLAQKIKDNIGITMRVQLMNYGAVPRSQGGKLSRVLDLRE